MFVMIVVNNMLPGWVWEKLDPIENAADRPLSRDAGVLAVNELLVALKCRGKVEKQKNLLQLFDKRFSKYWSIMTNLVFSTKYKHYKYLYITQV